MVRRRGPGAVVVTLALALSACAGSGGSGTEMPAASTVPRDRTPAIDAALTGRTLALHSMAYLVSNRVTLFSVVAQGPTNLTVAEPAEVSATFWEIGTPVWVGMTSQRLTVREHAGSGRLVVATDGCGLTGSCLPRSLLTPTAYPVVPAPTPGTVLNAGFGLHLATAAVRPGRYDFDFPVRYASNPRAGNVLNAHDTLHVRLDIASQPASRAKCTLADLHQPLPPIPAPRTVQATSIFGRADQRLDPPEPGYRPRVSAARAAKLISAGEVPTGGGTVVFVLASVTSTFPRLRHPDGSMTPDIDAEPAWVLYSHDRAVDPGSFPRPPPEPGETSVAGPPCVFLDGVTAIDANTGKDLIEDGFSPAADPIVVP